MQPGSFVSRPQAWEWGCPICILLFMYPVTFFLTGRYRKVLIYNPGQNYVGQACRMHCLDHLSVIHMETNVLWAKSYLPPPSPHAMLFVRKGLPTSRPTLHRGGGEGGGEGGSKRILQQLGKKALCPTHFGQDCSFHYLPFVHNVEVSVR